MPLQRSPRTSSAKINTSQQPGTSSVPVSSILTNVVSDAIDHSVPHCVRCNQPCLESTVNVECFFCGKNTHATCSQPPLSTQLLNILRTQKSFTFRCCACELKMDRSGGAKALLASVSDIGNINNLKDMEIKSLSQMNRASAAEIDALKAKVEALIKENHKLIESVDLINMSHDESIAKELNDDLKSKHVTFQSSKRSRKEVDNDDEMPITDVEKLRPMIAELIRKGFEEYVKEPPKSAAPIARSRSPSVVNQQPTPLESRNVKKKSVSSKPAEKKQVAVAAPKKQVTFAQALTEANALATSTRNLKILGDPQQCAAISNRLRSDPEFKKVHFSNDIAKGPGGLTVTCTTNADAIKLDELLTNKYAADVTSKKMDLRLPQIKLTGFPADVPRDTLRDELAAQNLPIAKLHYNIITSYNVAATNNILSTVVIESDVRTHSKLVAQKFPFYGLKKINIHEVVNVVQCIHCQQFGHIKINCTSDQHCRKCSGKHDYKDCTVDDINCANCVAANEKGADFDSGHRANDPRCPCFKKRVLAVKKKLLSKNK